MVLQFLDKYRDLGLLILRIGIGIMFIMHGFPKLIGGVEKWEMLGRAMGVFGIGFAPAFWGFMASLAEFIGGVSLVLGFFFRPFCFLLLFTMITAAFMHIARSDFFVKYSHATESAILFLSLILIGPGKYSLDVLIRRRKDSKS